jgi:hypothetical protein
MTSRNNNTPSSSANAAAVHVGTPAPNFQDWATTKVYFHGFKELTKTFVNSKRFSCLGHEWIVRLYPFGGHAKQRLGIVLYNQSALTSTDDIDCLISVKDLMDNTVHLNNTIRRITHNKKKAGFTILREDVISYLVNDALSLEVRMKTKPSNNLLDPPYLPSKFEPTSILADLCNDKESVDVVFEVGMKRMQDVESRQKTARTETAYVYAHSIILKKAAPLLAELCKTADDKTPTTIQIPDMSRSIFEILLTFIYSGRLPWPGQDLKDVIKAADRFGIINLKLEAESHYASSTTLTLDNVMENLHFADSLNCALLKETVMDFIIKNKRSCNIIDNFYSVSNNDSIIRRPWRFSCNGPRRLEIFTDLVKMEELVSEILEESTTMDGHEMMLATAVPSNVDTNKDAVGVLISRPVRRCYDAYLHLHLIYRHTNHCHHHHPSWPPCIDVSYHRNMNHQHVIHLFPLLTRSQPPSPSATSVFARLP